MNNIQNYININYMKLNKNRYLQALFFGLLESKYNSLYFQVKNLRYQPATLKSSLQEMRNMQSEISVIIKQLQECTPITRQGTIFKQQLLENYQNLYKLTIFIY
jgi:hypothetical protein